MGRAERRRIERNNRIEERKGKVLVSREALSESKKRIVDQANKYSTEYLMTCFALTMHRMYGFGAKRILATLQYVDGLMGEILYDYKTMDDFIKELKDETGVEIKCDD